jgi:hypothetical protein
MFFNKIELVNVDLRDTVPESSVCHPKWWQRNKFTPVQFIDTVIKTIPGISSTTGYAITDTMFRYEVKVCCGEWGDYTNYSAIEYDCNMLDDYFLIYNELYYDFEITDDFMPEIVRASLKKNDKPYGFGMGDNYMTQGNQINFNIYSLEDLEDFKQHVIGTINTLQKQLKDNIKIYEILHTGDFKTNMTKLNEQQKELTLAKKNLVIKTAKSVMNLIKLGDDFNG